MLPMRIMVCSAGETRRDETVNYRLHEERMSMEKHVQKETILAEAKSHLNNDTHNASVPAQMWFQEAPEGTVLFVVFYAKACRWSQCLGCNLSSKMSSRHVGHEDIIAQVNHLFADARVIAARGAIRKMIVSNNGSVLDRDTFPSAALMFLLAQIKLHLPGLSVLSLETRPEYVDRAALALIGKALAEGGGRTRLEIAVGFEAFDNYIRNDVFRKGLALKTVEQLAENMALYQHRLKYYFMQKPIPAMTDAEAVADIRQAIDYLASLSFRCGIDVNMHLNPTYAAAGTMLGNAFEQGAYTPPRLLDVAEAVRHARGKRLSVFIGLNDEGLAVQGGSFIRSGDESLLAALEQFNITQDYDILDAICST